MPDGNGYMMHFTRDGRCMLGNDHGIHCLGEDSNTVVPSFSQSNSHGQRRCPELADSGG